MWPLPGLLRYLVWAGRACCALRLPLTGPAKAALCARPSQAASSYSSPVLPNRFSLSNLDSRVAAQQIPSQAICGSLEGWRRASRRTSRPQKPKGAAAMVVSQAAKDQGGEALKPHPDSLRAAQRWHPVP